jgi:archaellum component FlaF (FlaF/FlaG flagellin family)
MKHFLLTIMFSIGLVSVLNAQWVSPGNGTTYTMSNLVDITNEVVTFDGTNYHIHSDLTISTNDVLKIDNGYTKVFVENAHITINGTMICENANRVVIMGDPSFTMLFDNATACEIKKMYFSDGAGIKLIESDVTFDDVKFVYFTTEYCHSAIDIFNCDPVIQNCFFMLNEGAAIGSPVNGQSSPKILNCDFDSNVDGANIPQINLGPGSEDTIYIVGNFIDGTYAHFYTGGISIADLMGIGDTKILLKDNVIKNNRYGYNQQGYHLSSLIIGNEFLDNYHEDNPMNGGSGISIYGMDENNKAVIRDNVITGNLWGITAINGFDIDLGTEDDWGHNEIHNNANSSATYDLYNNSAYDIMAVGNDWGTTSEQEVEDHIVHQHDNPSYGLVTFIPFIGYDAVGETEDAAFVVAPNPAQGCFTVEGKGKLTIVNTLGQTLLSTTLDGQETIELPQGIYLVKLDNAVQKVLVK